MAAFSLMLYGLNTYVLVFLFGRRVKATRMRQKQQTEDFFEKIEGAGDEAWPLVTTQIPLYNEYNVARRIIDAVAQLDYPVGRHQIQVVDDSTDDTQGLVDEAVKELKAQGIWIDVCRRETREGYKAGALKEAMDAAKGEFFAIFDSDFIPEPDFLRRMLPLFVDEKTGLVQARWGHLNTDHSSLTRMQSMGIDGHFVVEQLARAENGLFLNFNGTAGVWRKEAILDGGGWQADTLTEDLDLSYRCQLKGWKLDYAIDVVVPAELPETYSAFKTQQFRWAKGSVQTAKKLLGQVLRSSVSPLAKMQAVFHMLHYFAHIMMFTLALLALPLSGILPKVSNLFGSSILILPLVISTIGPSVLYLVSQRFLYPDQWVRRLMWLPSMVMIGFGICISNTRAVLEALLGVKSGFVRTPKSGEKTVKSYKAKSDWVPYVEIGAGVYCTLTMVSFVMQGVFGGLVFFLFYALGFFGTGVRTLMEQRGSA